MTLMTGRIPIDEITPTLACGEYPAKAVVGELVPIGAVSYRDGHGAIGCNVSWRGPDGQDRPFTRMASAGPGTDRWTATIRPDAVGTWTFTVEAFADPYLTWRTAVVAKLEAGQGPRELANDFAMRAVNTADGARRIVVQRGDLGDVSRIREDDAGRDAEQRRDQEECDEAGAARDFDDVSSH